MIPMLIAREPHLATSNGVQLRVVPQQRDHSLLGAALAATDKVFVGANLVDTLVVADHTSSLRTLLTHLGDRRWTELCRQSTTRRSDTVVCHPIRHRQIRYRHEGGMTQATITLTWRTRDCFYAI